MKILVDQQSRAAGRRRPLQKKQFASRKNDRKLGFHFGTERRDSRDVSCTASGAYFGIVLDNR